MIQTEIMIADEIKKGTFPGIVVLVRKDGSKIFSIVRGQRQLSPVSRMMTSDTIFDLASLTKSLATTVTALSLFEEEGISPMDIVGKFIPEIADETAGITLHQLFTHTSGLPSIPEIFKLFPCEDDIDREKSLNHLFSLTPIVKPGKEVIYSCTGYILLTLILERITGSTLPELFTRLVIEPGGIHGLLFNPSSSNTPIAATEYCSWRKRWLKGEVHDENSFCLNGSGGNAGLFGTASAIMELLGLFSNGGFLNGNKILSKESIRLMTSNQTPGLSPKRAYGFLMQDEGTMAGQDFGSGAFGHTGFTGTSVWVDRERKLEFVILTNRVHLGRETNSDKIISFRKKIHSVIMEDIYRGI